MQEQVSTGRRKTAVASVRIRDGKGNIDVNGRSFENYFPVDLQRRLILDPIEKVGLKSRFDIIVRVRGGGTEAQAEAVRLGLSRALVKGDETRRPLLKEVGYLTRDSRKRERKKYGRAGARKRFQFSKR
jgi:small subunit ribosomal protein S9